MQKIKEALATAAELATKAAESTETARFISELAKMLSGAFANGKKVLICGNGGSAADAMHFAEEFTGRYRKDRVPLPVIAISDPTHLTCVGNDYGFEEVFSRGVEAFGRAGDVFIGISTSGNSENVVKALNKAQSLKLKTVLLLGKNGGILRGKADLEIIVEGETTDRIQELHMMILHMVIEQVERIMFPENYR